MTRGIERGFVRLKTVFLLALLCGLIFVGIKVVPVYFSNYQLQDRMQTEARFALENRKTEDNIRDAILREAKNQELPVGPENIRVKMTPQGPAISASYTVPIDLRFYRFDLHFNPSAGGY